MRVSSEWHSPYVLAFLGLAVACLGGAVGFVAGTRQSRGPTTPGGADIAPAAGVATTVPAPLVDESQLTAYKNVLAADPKNAAAAIQLGNLLYDAGRYADAVPYYRQALALQPTNVGVSTDLGTALFYSGRPDDALAQYAVSLTTTPTHAQTLFNIGVVQLEGMQDPKAAIAAWERLIAAAPATADAEKARQRIEDARHQLVGFHPIPLQSSR